MMRSDLSRDELLRIIRLVRRRWRARVALRGLALLIGAGLAVFLVSAFGMDRFRFDADAVLVFRILAYGAVLVLVFRFLVWPLSRRISDERVALYLEENEPELQAQLLSAVEFGALDKDGPESYSPALIRRTVERAVETCASIDHGRRIEAAALARSSGLLAGTTVAALAVLLLSPSFVQHSGPFLFPWKDRSAANPYRIEVTPGDVTVARGAEVKIRARLENFSSDDVDIAVQRDPDGEWERFGMAADEETGERVFFLFDLQNQAEYFVEASGVRSPLFRIDVVELPYVAELVLEYHYPAYTGLEPKRQESGGDIAAIRGTEVRLHVTPTVPVAGAMVTFETGDTLALEASGDGSLGGALRISRQDLYRVVFETVDGELLVGSPDYLIDVLSDQPPYVAFRKPGRDVKVTRIEEVFTEVEAEDDYGVGSVELVYAVNGGAEQTVELYRGSESRKDVSAGHTFYLEEFELAPGDFISYYARARDRNRVSGSQETTTDIYFMEVRPFDRTFRQADQGGAAAGPGGFDSSLSQWQRDVIAATFRVIRDRERYSDDEYAEHLTTLVLSQGRLREQVEVLVSRIRGRGVVQMDSGFATVAEALPKAVEAMREAEVELGERRPSEALSPEQRALQQLQRAEAAFREVQVSRGASSGGGGSGSVADAEELAELFELELDKQRNQYESIQRQRQREVDQQIDETLQKLQELARRQQQENEHLQARAQAARNQSGSGGRPSQRRLAEETEELARRLERLAREESLPELNRTAQQLREAAEEMRRASANSEDSGAMDGRSALQRLREARRRLDRNRSAGLRRAVDDAARRAERLVEEQRDVVDEVEQMEEAGASRSDRIRRLLERKQEMAEEVAELETQLDHLARESSKEQRDAARKLREAANSIRDAKLEDKIRYSRGVIQERSGEYARNFERQIEDDLQDLRERIAEARDAVGQSAEDRLSQTLEEARDLTRSLESLEQRLNDRARGEPGQSDAESESGETPPDRPTGTPREAEATSDGFPGLAPEDVRQFRREFRERRGEAERLRQELQRQGIETEELEGIIQGLERLEQSGAYGDIRGIGELQAQIIQNLKEFEYVLRRQLGGEEQRELLLTGSDEVPPGYRELVEQYYRSLAEEDPNR